MGESEGCGAAFCDFFEYELFCDCAAADESAGDGVWWGFPATAAAGDGAEEWVG